MVSADKGYTTTIKPVSQEQIRRMYWLARKAGMDSDDLHAMAHGISRGKESLKALTSREGMKLIDRLQQLAGVEPAEPTGRATKAQQNMIYSLAREMGWADDPSRLRGFLKARFDVEDPRWLTDKKAAAAIQAMKAMRDGGRGERKRGVENG